MIQQNDALQRTVLDGQINGKLREGEAGQGPSGQQISKNGQE